MQDPTVESTPPKGSGLPHQAYEPVDGEAYPPYVRPDASIPEMTIKAIVMGILIGVVFGAANAYLGLRVGITVSASIPAAVMAIVLFRAFRRGTVLETRAP